ncbi:MAG: hypothetical protein WD579_03645 [Candidatus Paceibacterota bacterium]
MSVLDDIHIGILRGGTSNEYHDSLSTGAGILSDLSERNVNDILIDRTGQWYYKGVVHEPRSLLTSVDVVVNGLHGGIGEDGTIQRTLFNLKIPHTGSGALASSLSLHKPAAKKLFVKAGIRTPRYSIFTPRDPHTDAHEFVRNFSLPVMIKAVRDGGSHGVHRAESFADIRRLLEQNRGEVLIEEYIFGKMVTCGVVSSFRSEEIYPLFPVEVDCGNDSFYDHRRRGEYGFHCPSGLPQGVKKEIQEMARRAHDVLDLSHYSQSDFIVTSSGRVYLLEVNSLPSLEDGAPFVRALEAVGSDRRNFLEHVLELALERR